MRSRRVQDHRLARRLAVASMSVLAASGIGLVAAPMAFGQIVIPIGGPLFGNSQSAGVSNSGSASANSGGNNAVGNASNNTASVTTPAGAVNVPVGVGAPTNGSDGTAQVTTGAANAVGNSSDSAVGQSNASGNQVSSFLAGQNQSAGVGNTGAASANSGGNNAVGNGSRNNATVTQDVSGGLIGVGVTLGGPTNNSTGNATITSGAASAVGNSADNRVGQAAQGGGSGGGGFATGQGGPGGPGTGPGGVVLVGGAGGPGGGGVGAAPCGSSRFASFQDASVVNRGQAQANTGNNTAIGNNSTNNASTNVAGSGQTVSGGLLGVGLTIGGPVNNSSGTATINTGPATAVGNDSGTTVSQQQGCPQVVTIASRPGQPAVVVPQRLQTVQTATLARTGLDTGDLGMIAGALLAAGMLLIASQRRRYVARQAAVPLAGLGFGLGADDWDGAVR